MIYRNCYMIFGDISFLCLISLIILNIIHISVIYQRYIIWYFPSILMKARDISEWIYHLHILIYEFKISCLWYIMYEFDFFRYIINTNIPRYIFMIFCRYITQLLIYLWYFSVKGWYLFWYISLKMAYPDISCISEISSIMLIFLHPVNFGVFSTFRRAQIT